MNGKMQPREIKKDRAKKKDETKKARFPLAPTTRNGYNSKDDHPKGPKNE